MEVQSCPFSPLPCPCEVLPTRLIRNKAAVAMPKMNSWTAAQNFPSHPHTWVHLQRALSSSQVREATPSHMVGRVTTFSHWENWWKVKAVGGSGCEAGRSAPPPRAQPALTGSGADSVLLPVHLQAEAVHRAVGQQPGDSQLQEQRRQAQQSFGPGCRAGQSWSAGR